MSKGRTRCYFCKCELNNQNRTKVRQTKQSGPEWVDCCHKCKAKEEKR